MRQMETQLDQFGQTDTKLITEIMMRTGLRGMDARELAFDCLVHDDKGHPYLRYSNHKMRRTAHMPLDVDLAAAITAQRDRVLQRFGFTPPMLFPRRLSNPAGDRAISRSAWSVQLQTWLTAINLADEVGQRVTVVPHQFRHTFGTRMINSGVPQHIVQHLLDHSSPDMTSHYARLHDSTVRAAWAKARKINIHGDDVDLDDDHPLSEASWMRAGLDRAKQTLPNGYCGMPAQSPCEHANPCLTCPLFLTTPDFLPQHHAPRAITAS